MCVATAAREGAVCVNYIEVTSLIKDSDGKLAGANVTDRCVGSAFAYYPAHSVALLLFRPLCLMRVLVSHCRVIVLHVSSMCVKKWVSCVARMIVCAASVCVSCGHVWSVCLCVCAG